MVHDTTRVAAVTGAPSRWRTRRTTAGSAPAETSSAFEHAPTGMAVADLDGRLTAVNPALCRLLGRAGPELLRRRLDDLATADRRGALRQDYRAVGLGEHPATRHETRLGHGDGTSFDALVSTVAVPGPDGRPHHLVVHVQDVSDYTLRVAQMRERSLHDPLTGLPNRSLFLDRLDHAFASHQREGWPLSLLFLDLDGFKAVNDEHGHGVGDALLVHVGARLLSCSRSGDTVARMGGDEFAVLCERTGPEAAARVADRLQVAVRRPITVEALRLSVSASVGVESSVAELGTPADLLRRADAAMYECKRTVKVLRTA